MKFNQDGLLSLDFDNMTEKNVGPEHGFSPSDLEAFQGAFEQALGNMQKIREGQEQPHGEQVLFMGLPFQSKEKIESIQAWAENLKGRYDAVVSLGIGGSYLGNKTLQEALNHPYYNESEKARGGWPKLYFAGDNLDPARLKALLDVLDVRKTKFVIISKSGGTVEPMSSFAVVLDAIKQAGGDLKEQITAVTDNNKGLLRSMVDDYGWDSFEVPDGIGGRWCVLSEVGLLTAAASGIDIEALLEGARALDATVLNKNLAENPAALYALIHTVLYRQKNKLISVLMPYSNALKFVGDWYVQLLAESLGKKLNRKGEEVFEGRTPIPAVGTTDMHAQTQQHYEGNHVRALTFVQIADFEQDDLVLPSVFDGISGIEFIGGKAMSELLDAAMVSNERSLASAGRPNCRISLPKRNAYYVGQLLYLLEVATAFEGEFLDVNAYDQPGVEAYKKIMKSILADPKPCVNS